ncbi:MAG: hypothetical protein WC314_24260 [Vulcanimicrobiota bacterium]
MQKRQGYLLPLALVFLFVLLMLQVGMVQLQMYATESALNEEERLAFQIGTETVHTHLGLAVESGESSGPVDLSEETLVYEVPRSDLLLSASWRDGTSRYRPLPRDWATFDNLSRKGPGIPEFSFDSKGKDDNDDPVALGHTRLRLDASNRNLRSTATFSHTFPYGLYAPKGSITAASVSSFSNPTLYVADESISEESGRPVDIRAYSNILVSDFYSSGRAMSEIGTVRLPKDQDAPGVIGLSGRPGPPDDWANLTEALQKLGSNIARGSLDKTPFFDDQIFTLEHLKEIFDGNTRNLLTIFSVGQACKVPFFPIPAVQNSAPVMAVFYIHHPYPVDFSGVARDTDDSKRLAEIGKKIEAKKAELEKTRAELAKEKAKSNPDERTIRRLEGKISDLKSDLESLEKSARELSKKIEDKNKDFKKRLSRAKIPTNAVEDNRQVINGWSYLYVIGNLVDIVLDLLKGKNPLGDMFSPSRVVHLGGVDPEWSWGSGKIEMKANLTVPPGRTLKIAKPNLTVNGDIFLQRGALLVVDGNLTVNRPASWSDFKGVDASDIPGYPKGRVTMEEGSALVVTGDLSINGGSFHEGSVQICSSYGPSRAMTRLIQAGGDITTRYGLSPVVTVGDLVDELAGDLKFLKGFNDEFFVPLLEDVYPVLGKLPKVGAWQSRPAWFAKFATTIEYFPFLATFGAGGPWPIPLPYENCLRKVFHYVSIMYSAELNAMVGENLYTQSTFWFFGRGVTPVLLKVYPGLIKDDFKDLKWEKIVAKSFGDQALRFLRDDMPKFAVNVVQNLISEIVKAMVKSLIPFRPPTCGGEGSDPAESIEKMVENFFKNTLKNFGSLAAISLERALLRMKNEIYDHLNSGSDKYSLKRQLPGIAVLAGNNLKVGVDGGILASGLFVAAGDVTMDCDETVGTVISTGGHVRVEKFFHYPYFDRISVYEPKQNVSIWENVATIIAPEGKPAGTVGGTWVKRLGVGAQ